MRIIAGTFRSRRLLAPPDERVTRPITDRVKQSLFDRLVAMETMGGYVLDVFAGTGSLGLEALSRGADHVTFIERDRTARELLEQNIEALRGAEQTTVLKVDALAANWIAMLSHLPVRLIFVDPPFPMTREAQSMQRVAHLIGVLAPSTEPDAVLVLRTEVEVAGPVVAGWQGPDTRAYGSMQVHFYRRIP